MIENFVTYFSISKTLLHQPVKRFAPDLQLYAKPLWRTNAQTSRLGPAQSAQKKKKKVWGMGEVTGWCYMVNVAQSFTIYPFIKIHGMSYIQQYTQSRERHSHTSGVNKIKRVGGKVQVNNIKWGKIINRIMKLSLVICSVSCLNSPFMRDKIISRSLHLSVSRLSQSSSLSLMMFGWGAG